VIAPWKVIVLDNHYAGAWYVVGDLYADGVPEVIFAKNVNVKDVHYTSAVAAHRLDGSLLWTLGDASIGRKGLHHDVACQIHDWDEDRLDEFVVGQDRGMYDHTEKRIVTLATRENSGSIVHIGEMTGDDRPDILLFAGNNIYINENKLGIKSKTPILSGTVLNVTLYLVVVLLVASN